MAARLDALAAAKEAHADALSTQAALISAQADEARRDAEELRHLRSQLDLVVGGLDGSSPAEQAPARSEPIWDRVMNLFQQDRDRGWTSREVVDAMAPAKPANVRSVLSRAKKKGALVYDGGRYRLPQLTIVGDAPGEDRQATM